MRSAIVSLLFTLRASLRDRAAMQLEILALRHQLQILERTPPCRVRLTRFDRLLWAWKSRHRPGQPAVPSDVRALIRAMSESNPLWGAPRIHGKLLKLGIDVCKPRSRSTCRVASVRRRRPGGRSSPTTSTRSRPPISSWCQPSRTDYCSCSSLWPTGVGASLMWPSPRIRPPHGPRNNSARRFPKIRLRAISFTIATTRLPRSPTASGMDIEELLTAAHSPWQNAYAERLIGSVRRECLDHVIVVNETGLARVLSRYLTYYHQSRTHLSLAKDSPHPRPIAPPTLGRVVAIPQVATISSMALPGRRFISERYSMIRVGNGFPGRDRSVLPAQRLHGHAPTVAANA